MLSFLAQLLLCLYIAHQYALTTLSAPSGLILDITKPVNAFKQGKIPKDEFLVSISEEKCYNLSEHTFFYDFEMTYRETTKGAVRKMWQVSQILNDTLETNSNIQLIVFWSDVTNKQIRDGIKTTVWDKIYYFPNIQINIVIHCSPELRTFSLLVYDVSLSKLATIQRMMGISNNQSMQLGLGADPDFINNRISYYKKLSLSSTDITFVLLTEPVGNRALTEDYFISFLTKSNSTFPGLETVYRPVFDIHFDILGKYADLSGVSVILNIPSSAEKQITNHQEFSVIPYLNAEVSSGFEGHTLIPLLYFALEASGKGFNTYLMRHRQRQQLEYKGVSDLIKRYKPTTSSSSLEIIIDYSEDEVGWFNTSYFKNDLKSMSIFGGYQDVVNVVAIVFKLSVNEWEGYESYINNLKVHLADISSKPKIGCSFETSNLLKNLHLKTFFDINAAKIVNACKSIGGTQYILKMEITPSNDYLHETYLYHTLEPVRTLRHKILKFHQDATVYFQVSIGASHHPLTGDISGQSLFCHKALEDARRLFMKTITWANGYNFPVILNSALSEDTDGHGRDVDWLSFLRKVPHINSESDMEQKPNSSCDAKLGYTIPIIHNKTYKTDTCIEWIKEKQVITKDYFYNQYIGTVFHPEEVKHNGTDPVDVFNIMLQFLFHKFCLIEIVSGSHLPEILEAIGSISRLDSTLAVNSTVFISYIADENEAELMFEEFLNELESRAMTMIKSIHIDLSEFSSTGSISSDREPINLNQKLKTYLQLQNVFKNKIGQGKLKARFGIIVSIEKFFELIQFHTIEVEFDIQNLVLLNQTDYIVFNQKVDFKIAMLKERQHLFNQHLNLKRIARALFPHLEVYFRIDLDTNFTSDSAKLHEYLGMLSQLKAVSVANNFSYFVVEAFDNEMYQKNGWWAIKSEANPTIPKSYVEKEAELSGYPMWYPEPIVRPLNTATATVFKTSPLVMVGLSLAFLLLLISIIAGSVIFVRYKKLRKQNLSEEEINEFLNGKFNCQNHNDTTSKTTCAAESMKFDTSFELQMQDINYEPSNILGMGNCGTVFKGKVKGIPAAIKRPKYDCSKGAFKSVLTEVKVLCYIGIHSNVVRFIGAYTKEIQQGIIITATELCPNGSLEKLLRTKRSVISEQEASLYQTSQLENLLCFSDLHRFAREIANGMEYIGSRNIVHGDLSTRNVLLDENLTCKIGDFGLSRKLYEYQKYVKKSQEPLPWKWLAVESLAKMEFTSKSDVWSFGVTLWEIYSLGDSPYAGLNWSVDFVGHLRNGLRLSIPQFAQQNIFRIMMNCWELDVNQRPTFTVLGNFFRQLSDTQYTVIWDP